MNTEAHPPDGSRPAVLTLMYREGCHLCDDMERLLAELLAADSYRLRRLDIDDDAALVAAHDHRVPVLLLGERELCHHFLDLQTVREALAGYTSADRSDA